MNDFDEAPASVTYSVTGKSGFSALVTSRANTFKDLSQQMTTIETWLTSNGYVPQVKQQWGQKKEVKYADHNCPTCGARVVLTTTNTGKQLEKCETQKYANGVTTGCAYTKWL